jgi:hypothetical protein
MTVHTRAGWTAITLFVLLAIGFAIAGERVRAAGGPPPGPDRFTVVNQTYTAYTWWLTGWSDNQVACTLKIDHAGIPTEGEIYAICGKTLYDQWILTDPCLDTDQEAGLCFGYYLVFFKSEPATRPAGVALPPPVVWVTLDGCASVRSTFRCEKLPTLVLTGEEPLAGQHITSLAGTVDGREFHCDPVCQVDLAPTDPEGLLLQFWAFSSYGDSSQVYEARVRVAASNEASASSWYVDILTSQWRGDPLPGCSQTWEAFPPVGGVPEWLSSPAAAGDLATNLPYQYLAARLIQSGVVEADTCENGGWGQDGQVNTCGLAAARAAVTDWQNRFDDSILQAARDSGIPAQLLKRIFARESQFWPAIRANAPEAGLGQLTENGADTTLLWNPSFFEQFCPTVLDDGLCRRGYPQLPLEQQERLRQALVSSVNASCPNCPLGIDLSKAENSISIFAEILAANCAQTDVIVRNTYGQAPGDLATFEDLWRFTLVNYNAGPGCLTLAIRETDLMGESLDWEHLSSHLTPACQGALDYVTTISASSP